MEKIKYRTMKLQEWGGGQLKELGVQIIGYGREGICMEFSNITTKEINIFDHWKSVKFTGAKERSNSDLSMVTKILGSSIALQLLGDSRISSRG